MNAVDAVQPAGFAAITVTVVAGGPGGERQTMEVAVEVEMVAGVPPNETDMTPGENPEPTRMT